jgi:hypothetical protein
MSYPHDLHIGWTATYLLILILLLMAEMYAVGAGRGWALTTNTMALVERANWLGVPVLAFMLWLLVHFALRLVPIMLGREPITWL